MGSGRPDNADVCLTAMVEMKGTVRALFPFFINRT